MSVMTNPVPGFNRGEWRDQAACRHTDPELYFPAGSAGAALDQIEAAKAVCRVCPVQGPCLQYALDTNQDDGVWGGRDEKERRRLRRARREGRQRYPEKPGAVGGGAKLDPGRGAVSAATVMR